MKHCAIAVIGHVDHGKTALVRALTGVETDRLKEEQARGLSITLGFAHRTYSSGTVDFIDAPGHEDFIRAMVSGASGVQSILLAVSAVDGFERQTREHLQIASLLGVTTGVLAVTKADLLAEGRWGQLAAELERDLAGTALAGEPIVLCSSRTGVGLDRLNMELDRLLDRCPPAPALPGFFLPADRVFKVHGAGTVATGTLLGAALDAGDEAVIEPSGQSVTIRGLQAHGAVVRNVEPGRRVAVQLRGPSIDDIRPGDVICEPGGFCASSQIDALVTLSPGVAPLRHLESIRFLAGTRSAVASVRLLEKGSIDPGEQGLVQLRFPALMPAHARQRAILRRLSPAETIGGAVVLDPAAKPSARRSDGRMAVLRAALRDDLMDLVSALAARDRGVVSLAEAARLSALRQQTLSARLGSDIEDVADGLVAPSGWLDDACKAYRGALADAHQRSPTRSAVPLEVIRRALASDFASALVEETQRRLADAGDIVAASGRVASATHDPLKALSDAQRAELGQVEALLRGGGVSPPDPDELRQRKDGDDLLDLLIDLGRAVPLRNYALRKTVVFHADALVAALRVLADAFPPPARFKTGEAREALATSRKFIVPLLEAFDERGWTLRNGDIRQIAGAPPE